LDSRAVDDIACSLMATPEAQQNRQARPRPLAVIGLFSGCLGFVLAVVPAIAGPGGLAAGAAATYWLLAVLVVVIVLIAVGAAIALLPQRAAGVGLMLAAAVFLVGYVAGYLVSRQLGIDYAT
jgi:hypothetical protein